MKILYESSSTLNEFLSLLLGFLLGSITFLFIYGLQLLQTEPVTVLSVKTLKFENGFNNWLAELNQSPGVHIDVKNSENYLKEKKQLGSRCSSVSGRRIVASYVGNITETRLQRENCKAAFDEGEADICVTFFENALDAEFSSRNKRILENGDSKYSVVEPYLIYRLLAAISDGDVLLWHDSGFSLTGTLEKHICIQESVAQDVVVFWGDAGKGSDQRVPRSIEISTSFILFRKSLQSLLFTSEWLVNAQDATDHGQANPMGQLAKKWQIPVWPSPLVAFRDEQDTNLFENYGQELSLQVYFLENIFVENNA